MKSFTTLFIIPARGGSKGIPGKNTKLLCGKPLLTYSIDYARLFAADEHICISSESKEVVNEAEKVGLKVPFVRPAELATDTAGTRGVLLHALQYYEGKGISYERIVLLQPTSPFRKKDHLLEADLLYKNNIDMVVSVKNTKANPYFSLFEEDEDGFLKRSKPSSFTRRQDAPPVYEFNGSIYIINADSLRGEEPGNFKKIRKYLMEAEYSVDLDTPLDWQIAEFIGQRVHGLQVG